MNAWVTFFIERFRPLTSFAIIIGMSTSGVVIGHHSFLPFPFIVSCLTLFYLSFFLRLKNDLDDFEKDRIAFPKRALPRGVVSKQEVKKAISGMTYGLFVCFALIFSFFGGYTRLLLPFVGIYFWLICNDFFVKEWIERRIFIRGAIYQGFVIPVTLLVISFARPELVFSQGLLYAFLLYFSFFTFDICRKLDPYAHPASLAYVHYWGFRITYWVLCGQLLAASFFAYLLDVHLWLWPCEIVVWMTLLSLFKYPKKYRVVEMASGLSLIFHTLIGF